MQRTRFRTTDAGRPGWLGSEGTAEGGLPWEEAVAASPEPGLPAIAARPGIGHVEAIEADPPISRESGWGAWLGVVNGGAATTFRLSVWVMTSSAARP
jgi:hypothetical protein